ncbi:hypothetical protein AAG906_017042 [Vitis piasezkii]
MLKDDVRATTQQILVTSQPAKNDVVRDPKTASQRRQSSKGQGEQHQPDQSNLTPPQSTAAPTTFVAPRVVINYIHGESLDEEYNFKRKRQRLLRVASVREQVSSVGINDFDVRRILVDLSSSTNLLQVSVIKQIGFSSSNMENPGQILSGFNGASITSLGNIVWPVQVSPITLNVQFSIVEDLSPFNAILGRAWLHGMKVIPSTYHQMVSYLTEDGQIDLYGSQLAARQCYQLAREAESSSNHEPSPERASGHFSGTKMFSHGHTLTCSGIHRRLPPTDLTSCHRQDLSTRRSDGFIRIGKESFRTRLMTKIFKPLIGHTIEVYIDDIVVKSRTRAQQVLGVYGHSKGDRGQPDQIKVVMETSTPSSKKELQRLIDRLVALGHFIARFTDKLRSFFLVLKRADAIGWMENFSNWAINAVLFRCISNKEQRLVYYISKAMADAETRYSKMEQTTLALRNAQKLRPYFQAHPITTSIGDHLEVRISDHGSLPSSLRQLQGLGSLYGNLLSGGKIALHSLQLCDEALHYRSYGER